MFVKINEFYDGHESKINNFNLISLIIFFFILISHISFELKLLMGKLFLSGTFLQLIISVICCYLRVNKHKENYILEIKEENENKRNYILEFGFFSIDFIG